MIDYNGSRNGGLRHPLACGADRLPPVLGGGALPPEDTTGWARVAALGIPIAGGEALATRFGFREPISASRLDVVQPDVAKCGGLTEALAIAHLASAWNRTVSPHCWGSGVSQAATLQLLASLTPPATGMLDRDELWFELDRGPNPLRDGVLRQPIVATSGVVAIPDGAGLGVEIDEDFVRAHGDDHTSDGGRRMTDLQDGVALVTGAGRNLGRAIALRLAAEGAVVAVNDLTEELVEDTVQLITAAGGHAVAVRRRPHLDR